MRGQRRTIRSGGTRRGASARGVIIAIAAGATLAIAVLVAVSCQSARRVVPFDASARDERAATAVAVAPAGRERVMDAPLIRVRIVRGAEKVELDRHGAWVVAQAGARTGEIVRGPLRALASGGGIRLVDREGRVAGFPPDAAVFAAPHSAASGTGTVRVAGVDYPGTLRLVPGGSPDTLDVINVVGIEDYLPGVISRELVPGWHPSSFRVQAVAARTFALGRRERARRTGRHFDVESTTADQVYGGTTGMGVAHQAVAETRGIVLIDGDRLAAAYYSSTCGGRPASAEEIWPSDTARIDAVSLREPASDAGGVRRAILCEEAPLFQWSAVRRNTELAARIAAWAEANHMSSLSRMQAIADIRATEFNAAGRPIRFEVADQRGRKTTLTSEQLRLASNFRAPRLPSITRETRVYSNDLAFNVGRRVIRIEGRGFGHGVGMCQYCTQGMSRRGDHWRDILGVFYPEAEIRRVY
ncbi:MAG: SpoIID/LytB domain-containing protein [Planctomycetota bacterium]